MTDILMLLFIAAVTVAIVTLILMLHSSSKLIVQLEGELKLANKATADQVITSNRTYRSCNCTICVTGRNRKVPSIHSPKPTVADNGRGKSSHTNNFRTCPCHHCVSKRMSINNRYVANRTQPRSGCATGKCGV